MSAIPELSATLDHDVSMFFEQAEDFLLCRYLLFFRHGAAFDQLSLELKV